MYNTQKTLDSDYGGKLYTRRDWLIGAGGLAAIVLTLTACETTIREKRPGVAFLETEFGQITRDPKHSMEDVPPLRSRGKDWKGAPFRAFYDLKIRETNGVGVNINGIDMAGPNWVDHYSGSILDAYLRGVKRIEPNGEIAFKDLWYWDTIRASWVTKKIRAKDDNGNDVNVSFRVSMP